MLIINVLYFSVMGLTILNVVKQLKLLHVYLQGGPKNFLRVYNIAMVNGRKQCDMSKVSEFCQEKSVKLACHCI